MPDDDIQIHSYQDDLNDDDNTPDPLMAEQTDDPTKTFNIPPDEFKEELRREEFDDDEQDFVEDPDDNSEETDIRIENP